MKENRVIYGVKGSRKVEKAETGDLLMAYCCNEVVSRDRRVVSVECCLLYAIRVVQVVG